jgi:HPt (histidine-containing phosphotransfer) domain-containing protein
MTRALAERDATLLREVAHSASSMLAAFSAQAGSLASALEDAAAIADLEAAGRLLGVLCSLAPDLLREVAAVTIESLKAGATGA